MYQNPTIAVEKIASFLSIPVTPDIITQVVKHSSLDEMRQKASIGMNHLRAGGYGGWRNLFSASMNELFDEVTWPIIYIYKTNLLLNNNLDIQATHERSRFTI